MNKKLIILWILLFNLFGVSLNSYAQDDAGIVTINNQDTLSADNINQLHLSGMKGMKLSVTGGSAKVVIYHLKIKANREAIKSQFGGGKLTFDRSDGKGDLYFKHVAAKGDNESNMTWIKELLTKSHRSHIEIDDVSLNITIPEQMALSVDSKYSDVTVSSIRDSVRLQGRSGRMNVSNIGSNLQIVNHYGDITVSDVKGRLNVDGKSSHIDLENIGSNLNVSSDYSEIVIDNVQGNVNVSDKSGSVQAENIMGYLSHNGEYTRLNFSDIKGPVEIVNRNGNVTVDRIGSLKIDADYTNVQANTVSGDKGIVMHGKSANITFEKVNGPVKIDGEYLSINMSDIQGNIRVEDRSGSVSADNIQGDFEGNGSYNHYNINAFSGRILDIENRSGNISINTTKSPKMVNISNEYAVVSMTMHEVFDGHIQLNAMNGIIDCNLLLKENRKPNQPENGMSLEGNTGTGKGKIVIHTKNGNIRLVKVND